MQRPPAPSPPTSTPFLRQIADRPPPGGGTAPATGMVGGPPRPPPARRHCAGRRASRARRAAADTCRVDVQPLPPSALLAVPGSRRPRRPDPVRDVKPFTSPAPEARGLSYDVVQHILAAMSDQGSAKVKGRPRAIRREGPLSCPGLHRAAAQRADALPAQALEPDDANARWSTRGRAAARGRFRSVRPPPRRWPIWKPRARSDRSPRPASAGRSSGPRRGSGLMGSDPTISATAKRKGPLPRRGGHAAGQGRPRPL